MSRCSTPRPAAAHKHTTPRPLSAAPPQHQRAWGNETNGPDNRASASSEGVHYTEDFRETKRKLASESHLQVGLFPASVETGAQGRRPRPLQGLVLPDWQRSLSRGPERTGHARSEERRTGARIAYPMAGCSCPWSTHET